MAKLTQNQKVMNHLKKFGKINCSQAIRLYRIATLHSRISNLRNEYGWNIETVRVTYKDPDTGENSAGYEYRLIDYPGKDKETA